MNRLLTLGIASIGFLAMPGVMNAQERTPAKSAVVHPDHTVTFTTTNPTAKTMSVEGNWPGGSAHTSIPMVKDDKGVWTVTAPVPPDLWSYSFAADKPAAGAAAGARGGGGGGGNGGNSLLVVGDVGSESYNLELHDVPHGTLSEVWYPAPKLGLAAKFAIVYTPAGYETSTERYPVLYLTADDVYQWVRLSRAPTIIDNLIAEGKAKPMILVIADSVPQTAAPASLLDDPLPETIDKPSRFSPIRNPHGGEQTLPPYLDGGTSVATDLVPFIDQRYRTIADREHRAIAGISAPSCAAFYAAVTNPKVFAWIAGFSTGWPSIPGVWQDVPTPKDAATRFPFGGPDIRQNVDMFNLGAMMPELQPKSNFHTIYLYQGLNDALIEAHVRVIKMLDERGVKYVSIESPNYGHEWRYWSWTLNDWAPRIFREETK